MVRVNCQNDDGGGSWVGHEVGSRGEFTHKSVQRAVYHAEPAILYQSFVAVPRKFSMVGFSEKPSDLWSAWQLDGRKPAVSSLQQCPRFAAALLPHASSHMQTLMEVKSGIFYSLGVSKDWPLMLRPLLSDESSLDFMGSDLPDALVDAQGHSQSGWRGIFLSPIHRRASGVKTLLRNGVAGKYDIAVQVHKAIGVTDDVNHRAHVEQTPLVVGSSSVLFWRLSEQQCCDLSKLRTSVAKWEVSSTSLHVHGLDLTDEVKALLSCMFHAGCYEGASQSHMTLIGSDEHERLRTMEEMGLVREVSRDANESSWKVSAQTAAKAVFKTSLKLHSLLFALRSGITPLNMNIFELVIHLNSNGRETKKWPGRRCSEPTAYTAEGPKVWYLQGTTMKRWYLLALALVADGSLTCEVRHGCPQSYYKDQIQV